MLNLENYLSAGQTVISNLLLKNYHRIGLQSEEFLFVLQLCSIHGPGFLLPPNFPQECRLFPVFYPNFDRSGR